MPQRREDDGVRPVAVGETLRVLVGKSVGQALKGLLPWQSGVQVPAACHTATMEIQTQVACFFQKRFFWCWHGLSMPGRVHKALAKEIEGMGRVGL